MPTVTKVTSRTSSITNAFINSVIPVIPPSNEEIKHALSILKNDPENLECAYCGDTATEWDHLRALVKEHRPTGYISEIQNLVPACGKCNQSKGNKPWRGWITSSAKLSPHSRGIPDLESRINNLTKYEEWGDVKPMDFELLAGSELWEKHWNHWKLILEKIQEAQLTANKLRRAIINKTKAD
ncbi:MAG: HNH endonuclease [bacterium]|nr:HNH endonuclease [bacterium]